MRLSEVEVEGLFGERNLHIGLPPGESIAFLHGPNGSGKSTVLRMIRDLLIQSFSGLAATQFHRFRLAFDDGTNITVTQGPERTDRIARPRSRPLQLTERLQSLTVRVNDGEPWNVPVLDPLDDEAFQYRLRYLSDLDEGLGSLERIAPDRWLDPATGETHSLASLAVIAEDLLPPHLAEIAERTQPPIELRAHFDRISVHYIGADRLGRPMSAPPLTAVRRRQPTRHRSPSVAENQRHELASKFSAYMSKYAEESQRLDRTLPLRLLDELSSGESAPESADVRERLRAVADIRSRCAAVGMLDLDVVGGDLPEERAAQAEDVELKMLDIYLRDVEQKLNVLLPFVERLELFGSLVGSKFSGKYIRLDREKGYIIEGAGSREIAPARLSSGEQHELVLNFRLIFPSAESHSLYLVDEPELSLHVAWQEAFTSDLERITDVVGDSQFIMATHSPIIVGDRWDLMVDIDGRSTWDE